MSESGSMGEIFGIREDGLGTEGLVPMVLSGGRVLHMVPGYLFKKPEHEGDNWGKLVMYPAAYMEHTGLINDCDCEDCRGLQR